MYETCRQEYLGVRWNIFTSVKTYPWHHPWLIIFLLTNIKPRKRTWLFSGFQARQYYESSSILGSQKAIFLQADAIIMYLGLNCTQRTGSVWSPFKTQTFVPFSAFQIWTLPSVDPEITNCESGEKDASRGIFLLFKWPVNVCKVFPLKLSMRRIWDPFVDISIVFPSGLNFKPVHSISLSAKMYGNRISW